MPAQHVRGANVDDTLPEAAFAEELQEIVSDLRRNPRVPVVADKTVQVVGDNKYIVLREPPKTVIALDQPVGILSAKLLEFRRPFSMRATRTVLPEGGPSHLSDKMDRDSI